MEKIILLTGAASMLLLGLFWEAGEGKIGGVLVSMLAAVAAGAAFLMCLYFLARGFYLPGLVAGIAVCASCREGLLRSRNGPDPSRTVGHLCLYESCALVLMVPVTFFPVH
jgi:hypothetical protein